MRGAACGEEGTDGRTQAGRQKLAPRNGQASDARIRGLETAVARAERKEPRALPIRRSDALPPQVRFRLRRSQNRRGRRGCLHPRIGCGSQRPPPHTADRPWQPKHDGQPEDRDAAAAQPPTPAGRGESPQDGPARLLRARRPAVGLSVCLSVSARSVVSALVWDAHTFNLTAAPCTAARPANQEPCPRCTAKSRRARGAAQPAPRTRDERRGREHERTGEREQKAPTQPQQPGGSNSSARPSSSPCCCPRRGKGIARCPATATTAAAAAAVPFAVRWLGVTTRCWSVIP